MPAIAPPQTPFCRPDLWVILEGILFNGQTTADALSKASWGAVIDTLEYFPTPVHIMNHVAGSLSEAIGEVEAYFMCSHVAKSQVINGGKAYPCYKLTYSYSDPDASINDKPYLFEIALVKGYNPNTAKFKAIVERPNWYCAINYTA